MTVAELVELLKAQDQHAIVVLWDHTASDGVGISKLRFGEVQPVELGSSESNGLLLLERWSKGKDLQGPFAGVVLGSP